MNGTSGFLPPIAKRLPIAMALAYALLLSAVLNGSTPARAQTDPGFTIGESVVVEANGLNLRADAGVDAEVLAVLLDGTMGVVAEGPVTVGDYVWYEIDVDGALGWSAVDGALGWSAADWLSPALTEHTVMGIGTEAVVIADMLNLRESWSTSADIVTTLAEGTIATVVDGPVSADGYDWYELDADGTTGWGVRDYLAFATQSDVDLAIGDIAMVNTDGLNLRDGATVEANVLMELASGDVVTILDGPVEADGWTWFQVESLEATGWVAGEYLTI